MFNVQSSAAFIDLMLSTFGPFAQAKETVGELFSIIRQKELVLVFRPVCSQLKVDQGLIYAAELMGSIFLS